MVDPVPGVGCLILAVGSIRNDLVQAENVVLLQRRNELAERQLLAINQVVGVLDTAALVEMRRQVADGAARRWWPTRGWPNTPLGR